MIPPYSPFLPIQHPEDLLDNLAERRQTLVREFEKDRAYRVQLNASLRERRGQFPVAAVLLPVLTWLIRTLSVSRYS